MAEAICERLRPTLLPSSGQEVVGFVFRDDNRKPEQPSGRHRLGERWIRIVSRSLWRGGSKKSQALTVSGLVKGGTTIGMGEVR